MHRTISTSLSFGIIAILAIFVATYALVRNHNLALSADNQVLAMQIPAKKTALAASAACKDRVFQGEAKISVWRVNTDGQTTLQIDPKDVSKLPSSDIVNLKLVDQTPAIEKQLASSSAQNPVQIDISGLATKCDGTALAVLTYRNGIFGSYLAN